MAPGEHVPLEQTLALMLREDLDHLAGGDEVEFGRLREGQGAARVPLLAGDLERRVHSVGGKLIGAEQPEVVWILAHDLARVGAADAGEAHCALAARRGGNDVGVIRRIGQCELGAHAPAVGDRVGAEAQRARRHNGAHLVYQRTALVKQLLRMIRAQPALEPRQELGVGAHTDGYLVNGRGIAKRRAVGRHGHGPTLGRLEDDKGVGRRVRCCGYAGDETARRLARGVLDDADALVDVLHKLCHAGMERKRVLVVKTNGKGHRVVAEPAEVRLTLAHRSGREHRGRGDLVAVHVNHGQHDAVRRRIHDTRHAPRRGDSALLRLAIAHNGNDELVGIVKRRAKGMAQGVTELTARMDGPRNGGGAVGGHAAGCRIGTHELGDTRLVIGDAGGSARHMCHRPARSPLPPNHRGRGQSPPAPAGRGLPSAG